MHRQVPDFSDHGVPETVDELKPISVAPNWGLPPVRMPHFFAHGVGDQLGQITNDILRELRPRICEGEAVGLIAEMNSQPGQSIPIRVIHKFQQGHICATDLILRREGDDLYVRMTSNPRTLLAYLKQLVISIAVLVPLVVMMRGYLEIGQIRPAWVRDFALENGGEYLGVHMEHGVAEFDKLQLARFMLGDELDSNLLNQIWWMGPRGHLIDRVRKPTVTTLFLLDAKLGWEHLAAPMGTFSMLIGFFVWRQAKRLLVNPCRVLGWLTEDDYNSLCAAKNVAVERVVSTVLERHGIDRSRITDIASI